jgi:predicted nucleotidyltransferase
MSEMLQERNQKIIDAVIAKAQTVCPGSLALVGVSGSFATGRIHARSDLDLLIVINDEAGQQLAVSFVQDDLQVGHDLYCVTWEKLGELARFESPHIAKLMESKIVWSAGEEYEERLEALRGQARAVLAAPFGKDDLDKAEKNLREAEHCYALAQTAQTLSDVRLWDAAMVYCLEDGLAMLNKRYYRLGVRYRFEELSSFKNRPDDLCALIEGIAAAEDADALRKAATELLCRVTETFRKTRDALASPKKVPGPGDLEGTWEEMVSNWRGKMRVAAETDDRHLALMSLLSFHTMLEDEIGGAYEIGTYNVMAAYDPDDLEETTAAFEALLARYKQTCRQAGEHLRQYENAEAFARDYLRGDERGADR